MRSLIGIIVLLTATALFSQDEKILILENANYLDLQSGSFKTANILIQDGFIEKIQREKLNIENATVIDASSFYTIPGLIDSHIHLFQSGGIYTRPDVVDLTSYKPYEEERDYLKENAGDLLRRYLRSGITSVIDIGGPMYNYAIRDQFKNDPDYPNLFLTGPLVSTYQPPAFDIEDSPIIKVNTEEEARELVRKQLPYKPDFIKIWGIPMPSTTSDGLYDIIKATIDESKKHDLRVFVHATRQNTAKLAIKAGADVLVHSVRTSVGWIDKEFSTMLKDSNVVYIPTLVVSNNYSRALAGDFQPTPEDFEISNPFVLGEIFDTEHLPDEHFKRSVESYPRVKEYNRYIDSTTAINTELIMRFGNIIATGTDAGNIGTLHASSYFDEIVAMKKTGLSNLEVLKASTLHGAIALGKEDILGTIEEGKMADLVMLRENPLEELENLKEMEMVIKSGKVHIADEILKVTPEILAQQQLNAYNAGDIDAFLKPYSDSVEIYNFPDQLRSKGKEEMRSGYASFFENNPDLHCELLNRIVDGNTVIDHERITGIPNSEPFTAIAIYKIEEDKIAKVIFMR